MSEKGHGRLSSWPHIRVAQCLWDLEDGAWDETDNCVSLPSPAPQENWWKGQEKEKKIDVSDCACYQKQSSNKVKSVSGRAWLASGNDSGVVNCDHGHWIDFPACFSCPVPQPCFLQKILNSKENSLLVFPQGLVDGVFGFRFQKRILLSTSIPQRGPSSTSASGHRTQAQVTPLPSCSSFKWRGDLQ